MEEVIVFVTTGSEEEAVRIARALVERRLIACANVLGTVRSIFPWEGRVNDEREALMVLKTHGSRFDDMANEIKRLHSYDVPEIIAVPVTKGIPEYLQWVRESTGHGSGPA